MEKIKQVFLSAVEELKKWIIRGSRAVAAAATALVGGVLGLFIGAPLVLIIGGWNAGGAALLGHFRAAATIAMVSIADAIALVLGATNFWIFVSVVGAAGVELFPSFGERAGVTNGWGWSQMVYVQLQQTVRIGMLFVGKLFGLGGEHA